MKKRPVGRPRKTPRVKFSSDLRPKDAELLDEKEREGMRKNAFIDALFDMYWATLKEAAAVLRKGKK